MTRTLSLALAALLAAAGSASAQEKFTFALNWFAVGDHAAYWVALDKGYYKAKGLDVTLENSKGSGDSIAKVDTGRADAGLADAAVVIASVGRGTTIKTVGMVFDKTPLNIFSLKGKPLAKPKDLEGKTLGAPPGDSQRQMFPAFAKVNGIDAAKVTWVNIEPAAKIAAVAEKRMDGVGDYSTGLPLYEKAAGQGQRRDDAVGRLRLRHVLDVDHRQRQDHEGAAGGAEGLPRSLLHGLARRHGRSQGLDGDLQEARARGRCRGR